MTISSRGGWVVRLALLLVLIGVGAVAARAHDDENRPKTPSKAAPILKRARQAMDAYKRRLTQEGKYACCMKPPPDSKVSGCDVCAKTVGACHCGANLATGKGVCGQCYGAWKTGLGLRSFGKVDVNNLKVLPAQQQGDADSKPGGPEFEEFSRLMLQSKRILVEEQRFNCCIGKGGCDDCGYEQYCACGNNLLRDIQAKPKEARRGVCGGCMDGLYAGNSRLGDIDLALLTLSAMDTNLMAGMLGNWDMNREGSGTSWLPDSSPMYGRMDRLGRYRSMQMGTLYGVYSDTGGRRGESEWFAISQYMAAGIYNSGRGVFALRGMASLDPLTMRNSGYPDLFQHRDRQRPNDLFMELAASYSYEYAKQARVFLYFAPVGEPPLGPSYYQHRPSAWDNPLAPISHHWLDGTHIAAGVATLGFTFADRWKLEGAAFNGQEPDKHRYNLAPLRFDSYAGRVTYNPSRDWSLQISYAFLRLPGAHRGEAPGHGEEPGQEMERMESSPDEPMAHPNQHRLTASVMYNRAIGKRRNLALTLAYGKTYKQPAATDAWLFEAAYLLGQATLFFRYDNALLDEILGAPEAAYRVKKVSIGGVWNFERNRHREQGAGLSLDFYSYPAVLKPAYGSEPVTFNLFYRLRFGRM